MSTAATHPVRLLPVAELDPTVFANELIKHDLLPAKPDSTESAQPAISKGTFKGTQKALTAAYAGILASTTTYFDIAGFEPSLPRSKTSLDEARTNYKWTDQNDDNYPPHLNHVPDGVAVGTLDIFNFLRLGATESILDFVYSHPDDGGTMQALVDRNHTLRKTGSGMFASSNIGDRDDWCVSSFKAQVRFTDAVFSQQQLTGVNPVTLKIAPKGWLAAFIAAAQQQGNKAAVNLLSGPSFYIQDYSFFREAIGLLPTDLIQSENGERRTGAPIALFRLDDSGKLHIIAICIDFVGTRPSNGTPAQFGDSVVLFNKRLHAEDASTSEATDWPWRYAKTVFQSADWHRHEIGVHLTEAHLVEEATIVAANRSFPESHIVYQLLSPHWYKTLSLNSAARSTLVPSVIIPSSGMKKNQPGLLCRYLYRNFNFTSHYVPDDLNGRGFPVDQLNTPKFHNCAYARNVYMFWTKLRAYVAKVLETQYTSDADVVNDNCVKSWCDEMHGGGRMAGFPNITDVNGLIDAVTACIHIASPLHSAVNYLQNYYYAFVVNKPPALFTPLPTTLSDLKNITEADLLHALPAGHAREWLLASHIPWLLSYQVAGDSNILNWAASIANVHEVNVIVEDASEVDEVVADAAKALYADMLELAADVQRNSDALDDKRTPYTVLMPKEVAVSILI